MSSNLRIGKICESCKPKFIARKATSQTYSDACAKRLYKLQQREKAIRQAEVETMSKRKPEAIITKGGSG